MKKMLMHVILVLILCSLILVLPAASVENGKIAFTSDRDHNLREIYVMNADGTEQTRLTFNEVMDEFPSFSPDGSKIAFSSYYNGIWVMNADGTGQTRLIMNPAREEDPAWSPDGSKIAFASERDGNWEIYVMNADGTEQTRLTFDTAYDEFPSWSPDGSKIAFMSDRDGNFEVYVMNADGNEQTCLTLSAAADGFPCWSPDGSKIAFASERDGNWEIYVMNADGTGQTRLSMNPAGDYTTSWGPAIKLGSLEVKSSPPHAKIYINNIDTSQFTKWKFNDMVPGDYEVYVTLDGYSTSATEKVTVVSGKTKKLDFKLKKVK